MARQAAGQALLKSVGFLAIGGVITGLTYSMAKPGGTYFVTTGFFVFGIGYALVEAYQFLKWIITSGR